jgi:hypothetical protein
MPASRFRILGSEPNSKEVAYTLYDAKNAPRVATGL